VFAEVKRLSSCSMLHSDDDKKHTARDALLVLDDMIRDSDVDAGGKVGSGSSSSFPHPAFNSASVVVFVVISTVLFRSLRRVLCR